MVLKWNEPPYKFLIIVIAQSKAISESKDDIRKLRSDIQFTTSSCHQQLTITIYVKAVPVIAVIVQCVIEIPFTGALETARIISPTI